MKTELKLKITIELGEEVKYESFILAKNSKGFTVRSFKNFMEELRTIEIRYTKSLGE